MKSKVNEIFNLILTIPLEQSEMGNWGYKQTAVMAVANQIEQLYIEEFKPSAVKGESHFIGFRSYAEDGTPTQILFDETDEKSKT